MKRPWHSPSILALVLALFLVPTLARSEDAATAFDSANRLYEQGKYPAAAEAYDKLLASGNVSEALYFNLGNAEFRMGRLGRAIASYRQAQSLAPRDSALRANLRLARTSAHGGAPYTSERWRYWVESLSLNEWTVLTSVALWVVFVLLALGQWRTELKDKLRPWVGVAGLATVLFGIGLAVITDEEFLTTTAVVVAGEADVRNGPLEESASLFKVRDGMELTVTDKKDSWLQVTDATQRSGWLRQDQVITFGRGARQMTKS